MRQLFAPTFDKHAMGSARPASGEPVRPRRVRTVPSFVRLARDQRAEVSLPDESPDLHRDHAADRAQDGSRR